MSENLCNHDSTKPAMAHIECIKGYVEKADQWVVAACHHYQRNHVHHRKGSCAVAEVMQFDQCWPVPFNSTYTEHNVQGDDGRKEQRLKAAGKNPQAHRSKADRLTMLSAEEWRVE